MDDLFIPGLITGIIVGGIAALILATHTATSVCKTFGYSNYDMYDSCYNKVFYKEGGAKQ